jgi:hypothetical protein
MLERWRQLLNEAVATDPRRIAGVADRLGLSRSAISQVVSGTYPASTRRIAARVLDHYDHIACPHLGQSISRQRCAGYALRPCPTTSPAEVRHWRACQACPLKPVKE